MNYVCKQILPFGTDFSFRNIKSRFDHSISVSQLETDARFIFERSRRNQCVNVMANFIIPFPQRMIITGKMYCLELRKLTVGMCTTSELVSQH